MPASMRIDQAGLPVGTPGQARTDGLDTGALVTLTSVGGGTTHAFRLLWVPPEDTTAVPTLLQTGPTTWTFSPTPGVWGSYRVELVVDAGLSTESRQVRIFGVRLPVSGTLIPAANEAADPAATLLNAGGATIARSENNEPFGPFVAGSSWGWWRALRDLYAYVEGLVLGAAPPYIVSAPGAYTVPAGVAVGDVVYVTGANAADQADNAAIGTARSVPGVVVAKPTPVTATVCYAGEAAVYAGLTPGTTYYLGTTGAITTVAPVASGTVARRVGVAKNANTLVVTLGEPIIN